MRIVKWLRRNRGVVIDLDDWPELQEHPRMYEHLRRVTEDVRRWKVISHILFFTGIGIGWLMAIFL